MSEAEERRLAAAEALAAIMRETLGLRLHFPRGSQEARSGTLAQEALRQAQRAYFEGALAAWAKGEPYP